jgi:hypothetical protein
LHDTLGSSLLGVYAFGSLATGAYEPGTSDVDVQSIVSSIDKHSITTIVQKLSHASLPCPAQKLEFVLYTAKDIKDPSSAPRYTLNFNTGRTLSVDSVSTDFEKDGIDRHWFVLDVAMGVELGIPLYGGPPSELFAKPQRKLVMEALRESVHWHVENEVGPNGILNAARALRWAVSGAWGSKQDGAAWASGEYPQWTALLEEVAKARSEGAGSTNLDSREFLSWVSGVIATQSDDNCKFICGIL